MNGLWTIKKCSNTSSWFNLNLQKWCNFNWCSAYNIQFDTYKPVFIDVLSIKKYENGEYWKAHKQFCENFLNPLILKSKKDIDFNNWFKGNLEGITTKDLNSILNFKDKFSFNIFTKLLC